MASSRAAASRGPPSLEELARRQKQEEEVQAKPKFLSKKDRERLAAERAANAAAAKAPTQKASPATVPRLAAARAPESKAQDAGMKRRASAPAVDEDTAAKLLRERYMGVAEERRPKKRHMMSDKKFVFDWNASDDTSADMSAVYVPQKAVTADEMARRAKELELIRCRKEEGVENVHWTEKPLSMMKDRDWRIFKEDFSISTKGGAVPNPLRSWDESGLPPAILRTIDMVGYKDPSPIQRAAIPIAMSCRDVIGVAETGSGKTASFVLPLLSYIIEMPALDDETKEDGPYAIILAPTRELAQQIEIETRKFCTPLGFRCVSIVGGHTLSEQSLSMQEGAEIVIATPGRLVDCIERRILVLSQCCYVIMDEADRMIDLGFEEQVNKILEALPVSNVKPDSDDAENTQLMSKYLGGKDRYRQTMMYTATMPPAIERIARQYLRRPATVIIGNAGQAVGTVEQRVEFVVSEERRKRRMDEILNSGEFAAPIIVFVNIKKNCEMIARELNRIGWRTVTLHGGKSQDLRETALKQLRDGEADALVATDLAGRGIDVPNVSLVINFNMAKNIEDYTHRIGRTGRAGKSGVAITFLSNDDQDTFYDLRQMLSKSPLSKMPEELRR
ncbi:P-loop containing nucleoside triphosphate hydrolase protein [Limtongia smithiae]|uniref:P-loop containing nucleoside triphosphate hydrolase protein n=1 Tax=Limtongia smithiae TaxID=1125753 RepID=UPI0034CE5F46